MPYIKDMNLVEILILSQSETKGKFNAFHHKGESEGRMHKMCFIKWSIQKGGTEVLRSPAPSWGGPVKEEPWSTAEPGFLTTQLFVMEVWPCN